jgi:phage-related baseplate assembly protein
MSLTNFSAIDFNQLPSPELIEPLSFDVLKNNILEEFHARYPDFETVLPSEPIIKLLETFAYRELLLRQRINEGAQHVLLAKATNKELNYLGARFGVNRELSQEGTEESDERYRSRIGLALEGFSTAGPAGAYVFHTLKASPHVKDVFVDAPEFEEYTLPSELSKHLPEDIILLRSTHKAGLDNAQPGDVVITVLSDQGDGYATQEIINAVDTHLNREDIRPLTDRVHVRPAAINSFKIEATLALYDGPNAQDIVAQVEQQCVTWLTSQYKLGHDISLSSLYAVLHQAGVKRVNLISPTKDIKVAPQEAPFCSQLKIALEA